MQDSIGKSQQGGRNMLEDGDIPETDAQERIIPTVCSCHCGGCCVVKAHVKDGIITRIETDDGEEPQLRACLRGRAWRQRVYAPDRIKYPMKRIGARGEGRFEPISWDEALDTIAGELRRIRNTYGPEAILFWGGGGDMGMLQDSGKRMARLLALMDSFVNLYWGIASFEGGVFADMSTFGTYWTGSTRDDLLNSRLILMWGWDPSVTIQDTNTAWYLAQAREAGVRIISVDPRFTSSTATFAHQWIPIWPGTDAAMLIAMANVIITKNLHDQAFLDKYTVGFDKFKEYVMGQEDGVPKTPEWAEPITGVPAETIRNLAHEYAKTKPSALIAGIGPGRSAYGEQYHRAAITLSAMTGNIGIPGGSSGSRSWGTVGLLQIGPGMKIPKSPARDKPVQPKNKLPNRATAPFGHGTVNSCLLNDALLKGRAGGYPADHKLMYINNSNVLNQWPNTGKTVAAFKNLEFIVVEEQFMTPTARFADILLPSTTFLEQCDLVMGAQMPPNYGYRTKVIEPLGECKSQLDIASALAERLGIADFNDKSADEWVEQMLQSSYVTDIPALREKGFQKITLPEPHVAFRKQIEDPDNNPFPTPSGKIEIYSQVIADMNKPDLPPIPKYIESWESRNDPLRAKYPLQLITTHTRRRAHTQFDNIPWLRELDPHSVGMNSTDAEARSIKDGDMVRVFNDRGQIIIPVKIIETIRPGVVDIPQGAWYAPDENGIDRGGCCNVLTLDRPSPGWAWPTNTALVQIEKA